MKFNIDDTVKSKYSPNDKGFHRSHNLPIKPKKSNDSE